MEKMDYTEVKSSLNQQELFLFDKILYYHDKVSSRNKRLKFLSNFLKISIFILAAGTTVILGVEMEGAEVLVKNLAIIFGSCITLFSAVLSYLNIERFWMRSVTNHLKMNKLRDEFLFFHNSESGLSEEKIQTIFKELTSITNLNIEYWEDVIGEVDKS